MQRIVLVTINDRADFGKQLAREAFASRNTASEWAAEKTAELLAASDDPDYCDPVADFDDVWLTPLSAEEVAAAEQLERAKAANAFYNLDNARD